MGETIHSVLLSELGLEGRILKGDIRGKAAKKRIGAKEGLVTENIKLIQKMQGLQWNQLQSLQFGGGDDFKTITKKEPF
jgi:hypothetical protein